AQTNIKKLLLPTTLAKAGWAIVEAREDVEGVPYDVAGPIPLALSAPVRRVRCPGCGSSRTLETAQFGATACKALYRCQDCQEPFEYVKEI
ncbi:MAG: hypothetical protein M3Y35_08085, partial [Actinomycetota bacterium]|nr:hypothetical protein [Actinomycetota bacterium]